MLDFITFFLLLQMLSFFFVFIFLFKYRMKNISLVQEAVYKDL